MDKWAIWNAIDRLDPTLLVLGKGVITLLYWLSRRKSDPQALRFQNMPMGTTMWVLKKAQDFFDLIREEQRGPSRCFVDSAPVMDIWALKADWAGSGKHQSNSQTIGIFLLLQNSLLTRIGIDLQQQSLWTMHGMFGRLSYEL